MENTSYALLGLSLGGSLSLSGSLCSSGSSLSGGGSSSGLLVGHLLGNLLVDFLLCLQFLGCSFLLHFSILLTNGFSALGLVSLPSVELLLSSSIIERTLLHTYAEVLHQVNALTAENVASGISGLCAGFYPIEGSLEIQIYCGRIGVGVVRTVLLMLIGTTNFSLLLLFKLRFEFDAVIS